MNRFMYCGNGRLSLLQIFRQNLNFLTY